VDDLEPLPAPQPEPVRLADTPAGVSLGVVLFVAAVVGTAIYLYVKD